MRLPRAVPVGILVALAFRGPVLAQEGPAPDANALRAEPAKDAEVVADDGAKLAATFWKALDPSGAAVVLLHMYRSDRSAWSPLVPHLASRGVSVLAIDLRGHGGSRTQGGKDLTDRVNSRDPALFGEMHRDATAGVEWLVKAGYDAKRIAFAGASVGCSVAVDAARRNPGRVAAVVCLSPGANYLGLDSVAHGKEFPKGVPLLLLTHREELDAGAQAVADAVPGSRLLVYDDPQPAEAEGDPMWAHGTRMFGRIPLVEQTVASFVASRTGSKTDDVVLDGVLGAAGPWKDPWEGRTSVASGTGKAWAFVSGDRVAFAGTAPAGCEAVVVEFAATGPRLAKSKDAPLWRWQQAVVDVASGRVAWGATGVPGIASRSWPGDVRPPAAVVPALAIRVVPDGTARSFEGEWRIPGTAPHSGLRSEFRCRIRFEAKVPPRPEKPEADPARWKVLPSR